MEEGPSMQDRAAAAEDLTGLDPLVCRAADRFRAAFGRTPRWLAASPGRVNLIGEHTDYNDGFVLPMAIDRYIVLAADRPGGPAAGDEAPRIRIRSEALDAWAAIAADGSGAASAPRWTSYVWGIFAGLKPLGIDAGPLDLLIDASLPLGGGLSSSAALEVATATLLEAVCGRGLDPLEKARLCQKAEQDAVGVPCGIMDQFSTVFGRPGSALLLDCRSLEAEAVSLGDPEVTVLVVDTRVKHALADGAYAVRRAQCETAARTLGVQALRDATLDRLETARSALEPVVYRRARHVITENERTVHAAAAIRAADWPAVGRLMRLSHASLRDDYEVSCPELDWLVDRLDAAPGVFGARMTGGGFGGCTVSLVQSRAVAETARAVTTSYRAHWAVEPAAFPVRPVAGAALVAR
jgi:galactokinase